MDAIALSLWRRALDDVPAGSDSRGRLRFIPLLGVRAEFTDAAPEGSHAPASVLFDELKRVRQELAQATAERDALKRQLDNAKAALAWAQEDIGSRVWGGLQTWTIGKAADVEAQRQERVRLASRLDEARRLAGRHDASNHGAAEALGRLASWTSR